MAGTRSFINPFTGQKHWTVEDFTEGIRKVKEDQILSEMMMKNNNNKKKAAGASVTEAGNPEEAEEELGTSSEKEPRRRRRSAKVGTSSEKEPTAEPLLPFINPLTHQAHSSLKDLVEGIRKAGEEQIISEKKVVRLQRKEMLKKKRNKKGAEASVTEAENPEEVEEELVKRSEKVRTSSDKEPTAELLSKVDPFTKVRYSGITYEKIEEIIRQIIKLHTVSQAEASVTETGKPEELVTEAGIAEGSVTEAGTAEEAEELGKKSERVGTSSERQLRGGDEGLVMTKMEEQILLQKQMLTKGQKKKMKKKAKKAAEASVTEAGNLEEAEEELGKISDKEPTAQLVSWVDPVTQVSYSGMTYEKILELVKLDIWGEAEAGRPKDPASNALQPEIVFEEAEYHGAKFESFWNRLFSQYCAYDETTTIPAMRYTCGSSDSRLSTMDTLQVFSVKVASIRKGRLRWPLQVFGMISARDVVDRKRNIIFHRERDNCQTITEQDPYLTLTGPSRAVVVSTDPSYVEVVLKVKGATERKDKELSRVVVRYRVGCCVSGLYPAKRSTLELRFGLVASSIEATVHVRVTGGSWPKGFKGVFDSASMENASMEGVRIRLLDVGEDGLPVDAADGGMIRLSRRVISVQKGDMLKVFVSAKCCAAGGGGDEERCEASFASAAAGVSSGVELKIGSCRMEATVAWSLFSHDY